MNVGTLPFDTTPIEERPESITFYTDEETAKRLNDLKETTGLDRSLIIHRIVKQALGATPGEKRRAVSS